MIFRAIWPITDDTAAWTDLVRTALPEVPSIAAQAHARLAGPGRFYATASATIPGSGRVTQQVLVYEAPATEIDRRQYRKAAS